jgi:hypothetical protein
MVRRAALSLLVTVAACGGDAGRVVADASVVDAGVAAADAASPDGPPAMVDGPLAMVDGPVAVVDAASPPDAPPPSDAPPAMVLVTVSAAGGAGSGTVTSSPAGISCPATCSAKLAPGAVVLTATPAAGSTFTGWSGACTGSERACSVNLVSDQVSATAAFAPVTNNLVFLSSATYATNLGGATAYDQKCNDLATAAGLNDATKDAFIAIMSDAGSTARARLGSARGFVRVDGAAIADTLTNLFDDEKILNPMWTDENGVVYPRSGVWTGTDTLGAVDETCGGWKQIGDGVFGTIGNSDGGPYIWTALRDPCNVEAHLYCFMKTKTAPLVVTPAPGKRIWLSNANWSPTSIASANSACLASAPGGVKAAKALLATVAPARSLAAGLDPGTTYVRPDGQVVGTGASIAASGVQSGIWETGDGRYVDAQAWTGGKGPSYVPTDMMTETCNDWTSSSASATGYRGDSGSAGPNEWVEDSSPEACNDTGEALYCIEL